MYILFILSQLIIEVHTYRYNVHGSLINILLRKNQLLNYFLGLCKRYTNRESNRQLD